MFKKIKQQKKIAFKDPFFLSFPIELWIHIMKFASAKDILCLFMVSKASHCMMLHDEIYKKHILPYKGVATYSFRELQVEHSIPKQIQILLAGSAKESSHRSLRGLFYLHTIYSSTPEYIPCTLLPADIRYNSKYQLSVRDVHPSIEFPNLLQCLRSSKPTVIIIYPSSISELEDIVMKFSPIKKNEMMVVCSSSPELLNKARAMKCKPLLTNKCLSIDESQFILKQCIAVISNHAQFKNNQSNHKCHLM